MKKLISELSKDELIKVLDANEQLQNDVLEDMIETEMHWISEQLDYVRKYLSDWSVGTGSRPYLDVRDGKEEGFVDAVIELQKDYCTLADKENVFIAEISKKIEKYNDAEMYSNEYYALEEEVSQLAQELADKLAQHFKEVLDSVFDRNYQEEYFLDFYVNERMDEDCYINVYDGDYVLYEDVAFTKKYAK